MKKFDYKKIVGFLNKKRKTLIALIIAILVLIGVSNISEISVILELLFDLLG